jgi:serine/threonine-protein kinase
VGLEVGTRLGAYELLGPIGAGGMGEVYRARDTRLKRTVAIKVLSSAMLERPEARARFQREALAIAALNHPHICTVHDVGHERGLDFIVMEFVDGETLAARLSRGALPIREAVRYAREIASAVDAAHRRSIIHRDLKPSNIMVARSGIKLLDFGLAKLQQPREPIGEMATETKDISHAGDVIGTLRYMAPEVLKGADADARSDVFSFGAVFYEMLTGEPPFKGNSNARVIAAILTDEPTPIQQLQPHVPWPIEWITRTCLAKDPDERWQDAREVVRQLDLIEQTPLSPGTPAGMGSHPRAGRKMPVWAMALAAAFAVIIGALAISLVFREAARGFDSQVVQAGGAPHVVVLPCRPFGGVPEHQAQCDGFAATLTAMLGQLTARHALQVTAAGDVHNRGITTADAARRELGATLALEGSLMRVDDHLRVSYALVDTTTGRQIDGYSQAGPSADLFALQDGVVKWAIGALRLTANGTEQAAGWRRGTASSDAYAFALQARGYLLDYQRQGAIDIAISLFNRALQFDPSYAAAHAGLGEAYWRNYELTKNAALITDARSACRQAMNIDSNLAQAYVCSGTIASGTGEHEQAIALFERALEIDPAADDAYRLMARAQEALGRHQAALETYTRAVALRPHYWATHVWLANLYRTRGDYGAAAREYERAVELTPDNAPVRGILAAMYTFLGRYDDAVAEAERSIAVTPSHFAYAALGATQYRMRRFNDAVATLEKTRSIMEDYQTVGNLARAYYWSGQKDQARKMYQRAIELAEAALNVNPRSDQLHLSLAEYHARLGNRKDALDHLGRVRLEDPHFMFFAAIVHNALGDAAAARQWLAKARDAGLPPAELTGWIDVDNLRQ